MKLLLDMNLSPRWVTVLTDAGQAAQHWSRVGAATAADVEIMAYAASHDFVLLTHDLDFGAILAASGGRKPSVIQLRSDDISPEAGAHLLLAALEQCGPDLEAGALLTVDIGRTRLTLLPLRT